MRILYNSLDNFHKTPFGALKTGQKCTIKILVPVSCPAVKVYLITEFTNQTNKFECQREEVKNGYVAFKTEFILDEPGLYFYWFEIIKEDGSFRLFKQGNGTNMEAGDKWQITCYDKDYSAPEWAKGAVIYQIFPDRFCIGKPADLSDKIKPFKLHTSVNETPDSFPDEEGNWNTDFFGGNLSGIIDKLDYLCELGIDAIYLNPILKALSNHRYDTADYKKVDPMLGTEEDFKSLCDSAHKRGIKIILDGVFSHTGKKSIYFDDALENENSKYRSWYEFYEFPNKYRCWWGIDTLPQIRRNHKGFAEFIAGNDDSVIDFWTALGADGIRLDVADELSDELIELIRKKGRSVKNDFLVMGEVWEDASNKMSYGEQRKYLFGKELDSVMNYPFLNLICDFVKERLCASDFANGVMNIVENYPTDMLHCSMNLLSSHDTVRIITRLGADNLDISREEKANHKLNCKEFAEKLVKVAVFLQFTLPGTPSIYYGDEIGMEGFEDPFNRRFFDWSKTRCSLLEFFKNMCKLKHKYSSLKKGNIEFFSEGNVLMFSRNFDGENVKMVVNMSENEFVLNGDIIFAENSSGNKLPKYGFALYQ